jgi:adenylate cyclase
VRGAGSDSARARAATQLGIHDARTRTRDYAIGIVNRYPAEEIAQRAGSRPAFVSRLVELGILAPSDDGNFSRADVRRVVLAHTLDRAGVPIEEVAAAMRRGVLSLVFMDQPFYERFATLTDETFRELAVRTELPLDLLMFVREAMGFAEPQPDDRVREDEQSLAPIMHRLISTGSRPAVVERLLRVWGESLRRIGDMETQWWRTEMEMPLLASGMSEGEVLEAANRLSTELSVLLETAIVTIYRAQHEHAATKNIVEDIEIALAKAGVYSRLERQPGVCFLDITGYTRLTEERGDEAAAQLAEQLARLVRQVSGRHGGKPVKWLGDGVMLYFPDPGAGVVAALEMVDGVTSAGLPPAHVGIHAGPVLFQDGDYFGRTVNVCSRIADYARPGEVLASQEVVDGWEGAGLEFEAIGPVELKGVSVVMELYAARRPVAGRRRTEAGARVRRSARAGGQHQE